jgi:hypothetical protein
MAFGGRRHFSFCAKCELALLSLSATVSPVPHRRKEVCSDRYNFNQCIVIKPWPIKAKTFKEVLSGLELFYSQQSVSEFLL